MSFNKAMVITCDYCRKATFYSPTCKDTGSMNQEAASVGWCHFRSIDGRTTKHLCPECKDSPMNIQGDTE